MIICGEGLCLRCPERLNLPRRVMSDGQLLLTKRSDKDAMGRTKKPGGGGVAGKAVQKRCLAVCTEYGLGIRDMR